MNIAIIGTRGIPNHYGGFEQFAEYLSVGLVELGHSVTVYNSHNHPYKDTSYKGVNIIHCIDPEHKYGTVGQFIYDLNCIKDTQNKDFDIILQLGYTSSSIWSKRMPKKAVLITNMDGLEWRRTKFSKPVRLFIKYAEKLAVKYSDVFVADSIGIQEYLKQTYSIDSTYIPYGANTFDNPAINCLKNYNVEHYKYNMLIARLEPENSIELILDGVERATNKDVFLVVGNHKTKYGQYLKTKFKNAQNINFIGGIYDMIQLNNLRFYSNIYFHGHTVGGTNPSLLEAMASSALICANDNIFNRSILNDDALYFSRSEDVTNIINKVVKEAYQPYVINNFEKIKTCYSWQKIIKQYETLFISKAKTANYKPEFEY